MGTFCHLCAVEPVIIITTVVHVFAIHSYFLLACITGMSNEEVSSLASNESDQQLDRVPVQPRLKLQAASSTSVTSA